MYSSIKDKEKRPSPVEREREWQWEWEKRKEENRREEQMKIWKVQWGELEKRIWERAYEICADLMREIHVFIAHRAPFEEAYTNMSV